MRGSKLTPHARTVNRATGLGPVKVLAFSMLVDFVGSALVVMS